LDIDGSGTLEKREIANAIKKSADVRSVLKSHPALQRFLVPRRWEKTFLAMDTSMDGEVDLSEFIAFIKRTMAGVDPVVSGKCVELNKKWIRLPTKI
jgi:Ca2+-binding EF-hand superfamily protein